MAVFLTTMLKQPQRHQQTLTMLLEEFQFQLTQAVIQLQPLRRVGVRVKPDLSQAHNQVALQAARGVAQVAQVLRLLLSRNQVAQLAQSPVVHVQLLQPQIIMLASLKLKNKREKG